MFASIYHARVFPCVYINSRKMAPGAAWHGGSSSHDRVDVLSTLVTPTPSTHTLSLSFSLSRRENPVVHVGEKRYESGIRVKNASISRLLYFTRHCIRIRFYNARKKPSCRFQRHERKELCVSCNFFL